MSREIEYLLNGDVLYLGDVGVAVDGEKLMDLPLGLVLADEGGGRDLAVLEAVYLVLLSHACRC